MEMKYTFVDTNGAFTDAIARAVPGAHTLTGKVEALPRGPGMAFVSPANSIGFMDGGIDYAYSRTMWPGIEATVKAAINVHGKSGAAYSRFLPIGHALAVDTPEPGVVLIVAPTMLWPQDVCGTRNAYWAMRAAMGAAQTAGARELVVPGLCTGVGRMPYEESAAQIAEALRDGPLPCTEPGVCKAHECKSQPSTYLNTGFYPELLDLRAKE